MALSPRVWADRPQAIRIPVPNVAPPPATHAVPVPNPAGIYVPGQAVPPGEATGAGAGAIAPPFISQPVRGAGTTLLVPANIRGVGMVRGGATPTRFPAVDEERPLRWRDRITQRRIG